MPKIVYFIIIYALLFYVNQSVPCNIAEEEDVNCIICIDKVKVDSHVIYPTDACQAYHARNLISSVDDSVDFGDCPKKYIPLPPREPSCWDCIISPPEPQVIPQKIITCDEPRIEELHDPPNIKKARESCGVAADCGDTGVCDCVKDKCKRRPGLFAVVSNDQHSKIKRFRPYCDEYSNAPGLTIKMTKQPRLIDTEPKRSTNPFDDAPIEVPKRVITENVAQFKKHFRRAAGAIPLDKNGAFDFIILLDPDEIRYFNTKTWQILTDSKRNPYHIKYGHTSMLRDNEWERIRHDKKLFVRYAGSFWTDNDGYINSAMDNGSGHYVPSRYYGPIVARHWGFRQFFASWAHLSPNNMLKDDAEAMEENYIVDNNTDISNRINVYIYFFVALLICLIISCACGVGTGFIGAFIAAFIVKEKNYNYNEKDTDDNFI